MIFTKTIPVTDLLAHSKDDERWIVEQTYSEHIYGAYHKACKILKRLKKHISPSVYRWLMPIVLKAIIYHDLGKLLDDCQRVLKGEAKGPMPNHVDAGVAYLLSTGREDDRVAAWLILAHHLGFPNIPFDTRKLRDHTRIEDRFAHLLNAPSDLEMWQYTDMHQATVLQRHNSCIFLKAPNVDVKIKDITSLQLRVALSILVDADHYDTAKNYKGFTIERRNQIRAKERLAQLIKTSEAMLNNSTAHPNRINIRRSLFRECLNSLEKHLIVRLPSHVGTGKTFAGFAFALRCCIRFGHRRIIYVTQYVNTLCQTVDSCEEVFVLKGEKKHKHRTIGENHFQAGYEAIEDEASPEELAKLIEEHEKDPIRAMQARAFAQSFECPIICTTAVQFFETLAACRTGKLRKLHQIIGSVIFIDESHNCIPYCLWPLTLIFIRELVKDFGCRVLLASGTMPRTWEFARFVKLLGLKLKVPSLVSNDLFKEMEKQEDERVEIVYDDQTKWKIEPFVDWVMSHHGSKLVILDTILNAAHSAWIAFKKYGRDKVEHLSTSLTPEQQRKTFKKIKHRLEAGESFATYATPCIDNGVNFSFSNGWRELGSHSSCVQGAGRVRRDAEEKFKGAKMRVFEFLPDKTRKYVTSNPDTRLPANIFRQMYVQLKKFFPKIKAEHSHEAIEREIDSVTQLEVKYHEKVGDQYIEKKCSVADLLSMERNKQMQSVAMIYRVISQKKTTVVMEPEILLKPGVTTREIVCKSVQMYDSKISSNKYPIKRSDTHPDFYVWDGPPGSADDFLGYEASQF